MNIRKYLTCLLAVMFAALMCALAVEFIADGADGVEITPEYVEITEGPESAVEVLPDPVELGRFRLTFYCRCGICNGYDKHGRPRSTDRYGAPLKWGTVAVDPTVIPMHAKLLIEGFDGTVFEALDTGGDWVQGNHIDIYVPVSHQEAKELNDKYKYATVWRVKE